LKADQENIDDGFSPEWESFLNAAQSRLDLNVPPDYFGQAAAALLLETSKQGLQDIDVPEGYFGFSEAALLDQVRDDNHQESFFTKQSDAIIAAIRLDEMRGRSDLAVLDGYFDETREGILNSIKGKGKVVAMRSKALWFSGAAAAVIAIAIFFFLPDKKQVEELSFASLLERSDLDVEDVAYFASEDEVYDLFFAFEESTVSDTLVADSIGVPVETIPSGQEFQKDAQHKVQLDPRTGLPMKKTPGQVKPSANRDIPTWDEITNEDLLDYLLEEGDEDLMNDL
jgi:hypothetical protein